MISHFKKEIDFRPKKKKSFQPLYLNRILSDMRSEHTEHQEAAEEEEEAEDDLELGEGGVDRGPDKLNISDLVALVNVF